MASARAWRRLAAARSFRTAAARVGSASRRPSTRSRQEVDAGLAFAFGPGRRLRKHGEFVRAQRLARRVGTTHFTLLVAVQPPPEGAPASGAEGAPPNHPTTGRSTPRLGLVVSRKIGSAVHRNRVKRLCRECFRQWPSLLPNGVDLIVIAREGAHELGLAEVRAEWRSVEGLLKKRAVEVLTRPGDGSGARSGPATSRPKGSAGSP